MRTREREPERRPLRRGFTDTVDGVGRLGSRRVGVAAVVCAAALAIVASCSNDATDTKSQPITEFGSTTPLGSGTARSYIISLDGNPTEIGIALTESALDGLPTAPLMGGYETQLPLPAHNITQFQVIGLNWNPTGHPPPMVYTVPHFDFHFYMTSLTDRNAIDPSDPSFAAKASALPADASRPSGYVADLPANAVPHMGLHWTDTTGGEFHGQSFTRTFVAGSWNGQFTFLEPMVTRAYLLTKPADLLPVRTASLRVAGGFYPSAYRVAWDSSSSEWHIALANLSK